MWQPSNSVSSSKPVDICSAILQWFSKLEILNSLKNLPNSWICCIAVFLCTFFFHSNLQTKFTARAPAVSVLAPRTESSYLCRRNRDRLQMLKGISPTPRHGHYCHPSVLRFLPYLKVWACVCLPGESSLLICMLPCLIRLHCHNSHWETKLLRISRQQR